MLALTFEERDERRGAAALGHGAWSGRAGRRRRVCATPRTRRARRRASRPRPRPMRARGRPGILAKELTHMGWVSCARSARATLPAQREFIWGGEGWRC